jgi:hypothetical protein
VMTASNSASNVSWRMSPCSNRADSPRAANSSDIRPSPQATSRSRLEMRRSFGLVSGGAIPFLGRLLELSLLPRSGEECFPQFGHGLTYCMLAVHSARNRGATPHHFAHLEDHVAFTQDDVPVRSQGRFRGGGRSRIRLASRIE